MNEIKKNIGVNCQNSMLKVRFISKIVTYIFAFIQSHVLSAKRKSEKSDTRQSKSQENSLPWQYALLLQGVRQRVFTKSVNANLY